MHLASWAVLLAALGVLSGSVSCQVLITWPTSLEASLGPDAFASLPKSVEDVVTIRYKGNSGTFEAPVNGRLVSIGFFRGSPHLSR